MCFLFQFASRGSKRKVLQELTHELHQQHGKTELLTELTACAAACKSLSWAMVYRRQILKSVVKSRTFHLWLWAPDLYSVASVSERDDNLSVALVIDTIYSFKAEAMI